MGTPEGNLKMKKKGGEEEEEEGKRKRGERQGREEWQ